MAREVVKAVLEDLGALYLQHIKFLFECRLAHFDFLAIIIELTCLLRFF